MILCAGAGSRLHPLTTTMPKHVVPVGNRALFEHALDTCRDAGITRVVCVHHPSMSPWETFLREAAPDLELTFAYQATRRGVGNALQAAAPQLDGSPFLVMLGDTIVTPEERPRVGQALGGEEPGLFVARVQDPRLYGVATIEEARVVKVTEKPQQPASDWALVGIYVLAPPIFEALAAIPPSARGEVEITDAIQWLIDRGDTPIAYDVTGQWLDCGNLPGLLEANRQALTWPLLGERGDVDPQISGTEIIEPVRIGSAAVIRDSRVGPNVSVGAHARVVGCTVRDSILCADVDLAGVAVTGSLFGPGARLKGPPRGLRSVEGEIFARGTATADGPGGC